MEVKITREEIPFDEFFRIYKARLKFEHFDGTLSREVTRYSFEKTDAVAVLVYHISRDAYILVRQFRYPPLHQGVDPWLTEIVAGSLEEGENDAEAAGREIEEEIGYRPLRLEKICKCYVSPGLMNERVTIYFAEVDETSKVNNGGGAKGEDEDIELIWIQRSGVRHWLESQAVGDAKTIIALQWHAVVSRQASGVNREL